MIARFGAWWRRRYRVAVPLGLVAAVLAAAGTAHVLRSDDPSSASFLSPTSTAGDGAATLAGRLRAAGVTVERRTSSTDAISDAYSGGVTLFIPEPQYVFAAQLGRLHSVSSSTRIVLLAPDPAALGAVGLTDVSVTSRWATLVTAPACGMAEATTAGPAAADRVEYLTDDLADRCYRGGLTTVRDDTRGYVLIGASDPFRNDRIDDAGNSALATALLGGSRTVIWLDLHAPERVPPTPTPTRHPTVPPTDTQAPATGEPDTTKPQSSQPAPSGPERTDGPSTTVLLPGWVWAVIGVVLLAALAYTLSRARRFGPPVDEPLPVAAHGRETIEGRGRLYRRARQPAAAYRAPLTSALSHVRAVLGLAASATPDAVAEAVAAATGRDPEDVAKIFDAAPKTDGELVAAIAALDALMHDLSNPTREEPS